MHENTQSFDYVIVGAGAAGCLLAHRLSADGRFTVCLLEAGPPDRNPFIHIPAGFIKVGYDLGACSLPIRGRTDALDGRA